MSNDERSKAHSERTNLVSPALSPELSAFESIRHRDEDGQEYWLARELMKLLGYRLWQNFERVIGEAVAICAREGEEVVGFNFIAVNRVSRNRKNTYLDYHLTRHACYVIAQSADGRKEEVAWAKIYFALTTERYELLAQTEEDRLRVEQRQKNLLQNAELAMKARAAGAMTSQQFARFFNEGYQGLYDGETAEDIRIRKGLSPRADILDWMGSLESAANAMRGALALHHMEHRGVATLVEANRTHRKAGEDVRGFLVSQGVYPEKLPTPKKSYQQLLREQALRERLAAEDRTGLWSLLPADEAGGDGDD